MSVQVGPEVGLQNKMAELSTSSLHRLEPGATDDDLVSDPVQAAAVTRAIHDVVASIRAEEPLKGP